jgi:hypothetical protein
MTELQFEHELNQRQDIQKRKDDMAKALVEATAKSPSWTSAILVASL